MGCIFSNGIIDTIESFKVNPFCHDCGFFCIHEVTLKFNDNREIKTTLCSGPLYLLYKVKKKHIPKHLDVRYNSDSLSVKYSKIVLKQKLKDLTQK